MKKKREFDFLKERKLQISLLKMKVTVLLLLVCVLQSVAGAYSQTTKYDISMTSGKLENVFKLIEQKGEYTFLYSIEDIGYHKDPVSDHRQAVPDHTQPRGARYSPCH